MHKTYDECVMYFS